MTVHSNENVTKADSSFLCIGVLRGAGGQWAGGAPPGPLAARSPHAALLGEAVALCQIASNC